jgi:regulator of sirC expression with transglutaminase-like and TPR domain
MNSDSALKSFADLVAGEGDLRLGMLALEIGRIEEPELDVSQALSTLDRLEGIVVAADPGAGATDRERLEILRSVLAEQEGFSGDPAVMDDPAASCLHLVLQRRTGLPILLSVLYLELAWRISLPLRGVGLPGHFIVRLGEGEDEIFCDPFEGGKILDAAGCGVLLEKVSGGQLTMQPEYLRPWSNLRILWRLLNNLKAAYLKGEDLRRARQTVDRHLVLRPSVAEAWRDRGLLSFRCLLFEQAVSDLEVYLEMAPKAADAEAVRTQIKSLHRLVSSQN